VDIAAVPPGIETVGRVAVTVGLLALAVAAILCGVRWCEAPRARNAACATVVTCAGLGAGHTTVARVIVTGRIGPRRTGTC
jgi:hypothetical protein